MYFYYFLFMHIFKERCCKEHYPNVKSNIHDKRLQNYLYSESNNYYEKKTVKLFLYSLEILMVIIAE